MSEKPSYDALVKRIQELERIDAERRKTEQALKESEAKYRGLVENAPTGIVSMDKNGNVLSINPKALEIYGSPSEEATQKAINVFEFEPLRRAGVSAAVRKCMVENRTTVTENYYTSKWGKALYLQCRINPVHDTAGNVVGAMANLMDLTDRIAMEEALRESEERFRVLVEDLPDLLYRTDLSGRITFVSPSVRRLSGYTVDEAIGMRMAEEVYANPEERNVFLEKLRANGFVRNFQAQLKRKDGSIWWASTNAHLLVDKSGTVRGVEGVTRDVSDLKTAGEALKQSEERFRSIIESSPMGIYLYELTEDGRLVVAGANPAADRILRVDSSRYVGKTIEEAFPALCETELPEKFRAVCKQGFPWEAEHIEYRDDHIAGAFEVYAFRTAQGKMAVFFMDVADKQRAAEEKERLRRQLQQSQKFEAVGTLAGGIAHDFNNLLMGIQGRVSLMGMEIDPSSPLCEHIGAVEEYIRSATDLTRQLLGFARGGKYEVKPHDINALVLNSSTMFGRTRKEIRIHTKLADPEPVAEVDGGQIEQVLLNMYVNAWQAMPDGGAIYLETRIVTLDAVYCQSHQLEPGSYVKISVTDTGIGMNEATRLRVFDPFFTTKEKSRGTGLGLASAMGIIKNHGGLITVYSEIGHGTTFNIHLPASREACESDAAREEPVRKGWETVLLVDDEPMIIDVGRAMLEKLGYRALVATDGAEAVEAVKRGGDDIDLVLLDLIMPGMDGGKTFDAIREVAPSMPVLLSSGYSLNGQTDTIMRRGCSGFIQKPFNIVELSRKLRQILDGK